MHGLQVAAMAWILSALILSGGWVVSFRSGIAVQNGTAGSLWTRLPVFALVTFPFAFIAFRYERKKARRKAELRNICPKCDTAGDGNVGSPCKCGGAFVPLSTVKWVE